ncbi:HXXEE domain-containing protein [Lysinibacillus cavernae]|uniref:HXXEE domain-containing protein n=1 Tax=Lysinibacillus cavernae TaxID=2666135 RepID=UPI0012D8EBB2|nr:HXXEE domain-containing protein [Lysinibacillus cavernae]
MKAFYVIFFCLAVTLHNLEEALWLPQWSQIDSSFQKPVTPNEFHFAVLIITALAYLVSFLTLSFPKSKLIKWAFTGFLGSMIFNAFFPHLIVTIVMKTYSPGLITALLLNVPINTVILHSLHKKNFIKLKEIIISTVIVGILLLAMIPLLFTLGGSLINF